MDDIRRRDPLNSAFRQLEAASTLLGPSINVGERHDGVEVTNIGRHPPQYVNAERNWSRCGGERHTNHQSARFTKRWGMVLEPLVRQFVVQKKGSQFVKTQRFTDEGPSRRTVTRLQHATTKITNGPPILALPIHGDESQSRPSP